MKHRYSLTGIVFALVACAALPGPAHVQAQDSITMARGKGHGYVRYEGSGVFQITGGNGVLIVSQTPGDIEAPPVEVLFAPAVSRPFDGDYSEPACLPSGSGGCIYRMTDSLARIQGDNLLVSFAGANIGLTASGDALLNLKGYGMCVTEYPVENTVTYGLERWTLSGTSIALKKKMAPDPAVRLQ